jgi:hypothetical protein
MLEIIGIGGLALAVDDEAPCLRERDRGAADRQQQSVPIETHAPQLKGTEARQSFSAEGEPA